MTQEEYENLKPGDYIYLRDTETPEMEVIWKKVEDRDYYDLEVFWHIPSNDGNHFCNFSLGPDCSGFKRMKIINPENYPEYFI
jgi:hypothetical protein